MKTNIQDWTIRNIPKDEIIYEQRYEGMRAGRLRSLFFQAVCSETKTKRSNLGKPLSASGDNDNIELIRFNLVLLMSTWPVLEKLQSYLTSVINFKAIKFSCLQQTTKTKNKFSLKTLEMPNNPSTPNFFSFKWWDWKFGVKWSNWIFLLFKVD